MKLKKVIDNNYGNYHHEDKQGNWQGECIGHWYNMNISYKQYFKDDKLHGIGTYYKENGDMDCKMYYWDNKIISKKEYLQNILKLI